ncbi:Na+/H+-dicarboxylate symporter [Nitrosomonas halophila]|uniref:Na+/H+-dicarboxylate symporter n=2 Tax=Nitrosomonas halophila TaxID=44576 RepID=A0A1H3LGV2_9PROT|nr:Na+/H+-dicarboxylate symporter [Nitrosomonas halophila]
MFAGFVLGSVINLFLSEVAVVQEYFVNGLFHAIGALFINLLKMLVVPLVTFSLISGVCAIGDIHKLGRIGFKAFLLFILTTALAITLAIGVALVFEPGKDFNLETQPPAEVEIVVPHSLLETLIDIVPHNPVEAFATGNMLQIIFFSVLFATGLVMLGERGRLMVEIFDKLNEVMMQVVRLVMQTAPYGIFALMAKTFASHGPGLILPMFSYFGVVIMVLMIHALGMLMLLLKLLGRVNPWVFLRKIRAAQIFAFGTASSNATIPVTLDVVERRIGVENSIASFVIPFGATINMDGTAIMQGVATIFIANVYGIEMSMAIYLTIVLMTVVASIGTAGVPGVGLIMLAMVFNQVGLPIEGIALIMGVDRLLDMLRTSVNVTGDAVVATIIARSENGLSLPTFYDSNSETADTLVSSHKP